MHVWLARLDPGAQELEDLSGLLDESERERAARFLRATDARGFTAAHAHQRRVLAGYLGCGPRDVTLVEGPHGKPRLTHPGPFGLRVNLSHSGTLALVAVALGRDVGVDVEMLPPGLTPAELGAVFHPAERRALDRLPLAERSREAVRLWTRKEAVLKGLGLGLALPPETVDVLEDRVRLDPDGVARAADVPCPDATTAWTVRSLGLPPAYAAAVAVEGHGPLVLPVLRRVYPVRGPSR